jgi:hypothetical protein
MPNPEMMSGVAKPKLSSFNTSGDHCKGGYRPAPELPGQPANSIYFEISRITQSERTVSTTALCKKNEQDEQAAQKEYFDSLKGKDREDAVADLANLIKGREHDPSNMFTYFSGNEPHTLASYSWAFDSYYTQIPCYVKAQPATTDQAGMKNAKETIARALSSGLKAYGDRLGKELANQERRTALCADKGIMSVVDACAGVGAGIASEYTPVKELIARSCAGVGGAGAGTEAPAAK